ncbi:unnamed protein product [Moneuplotes crassus]|uniref:Uncharacterized protein n=1 Tax=Euplotes crassus TaxID=5936 RepID=A0AAD2D6W5_EUPCR|nr:unnamed protein product [Moneuplotes crassus]
MLDFASSTFQQDLLYSFYFKAFHALVYHWHPFTHLPIVLELVPKISKSMFNLSLKCFGLLDIICLRHNFQLIPSLHCPMLLKELFLLTLGSLPGYKLHEDFCVIVLGDIYLKQRMSAQLCSSLISILVNKRIRINDSSREIKKDSLDNFEI